MSAHPSLAREPITWILLGLAVCGVSIAVWAWQVAAPARTATELESPRSGPPILAFTSIGSGAGLATRIITAADEPFESLAGGCTIFDYDGDLDPDLLFLHARPWARPQGISEELTTPLALYQNDGLGNFVEVTIEAGLEVPLSAMMAAPADFDGDADLDLYLTAVGENRLLVNEGGRFIDASAALPGASATREVGTAALWLDAEGDGDLDLISASLGRLPPPDAAPATHPAALERAHPRYYRNQGDGTFVEVAASAGLAVLAALEPKPALATLALAALDLDDDGDLDVMAAGWGTENRVWLNRGDGTWNESAAELGLAFDALGNVVETSALAVLDRDRRPGLVVGRLAGDRLACLEFVPGRVQARESPILPNAAAGAIVGVLAADLDLDGCDELIVGRGRPALGRAALPPDAQATVLVLWRDPRAADAPWLSLDGGAKGRDLEAPLAARGMALGDLDRDGDLDLALACVGRSPMVLENQAEHPGQSLRLTLAGRRRNLYGVGAVVRVEAGGQVMTRVAASRGGYLSCSESVLTFGLGPLRVARLVTVTWPNGARSTHANLPTEGIHVLTQPE